VRRWGDGGDSGWIGGDGGESPLEKGARRK